VSVVNDGCSSYSVLASQADTHAVEAKLSTLDRDSQTLKSLLEGHISIRFLLDTVARLDQWAKQASDNSLFVDSFDHIT